MFRARFIDLFVFFVMSIWSVTAYASPITWHLNDVTFVDSGTASGSITVDPSLQIATASNITLSDSFFFQSPVVFTGIPTIVDFGYGGPNNVLYILEADTPSQSSLYPYGTESWLYMLVDGSSGVGGGNFLEWESFAGTAINNSYAGQYWTYIDTGSLSSSVNTDPVPEPSTMLLLGAGIAGIAFRKRRKIAEKGLWRQIKRPT